MLQKFVIIVFLALQVDNALSQGHYTIVASKNIRPNADYHVAVSVQDSSTQCNIVVSLSNEAGYKKSQEVTLEPYSTQLVQFRTDDLPPGQYRIAAEGSRGIIFKNETLINLHLKNSTILTQTDKAIYKPGDLIHFRVLFLDTNLRPSRIDGPVKITITDANDNRVRQWSDATVSRGVFEGELRLADEVALGDWKIRTEFNGNNKAKKFEVAEYVSPKFDVIIDTAKHQTYTDEKLRAIIRTKYFYGKPVKGEATVSVFPKIHGLFQPLISNLITRKVTKIDGKADIEFDIEKELNFNQNYEQTVQIEVVVEEEFSGRKQNTTTEVTLHKSKYKIVLKKASEQYKPGLPFVVTANVVNHDGSPVQDRNTPLIVRTAYEGNENTVAENNYNLDGNGMVRFSTIIERKNGFYLTAYYMDAEESLGWIQKADSRGGDYLQISLKTEKPAINKDVSVEVQSNDNMRFLTYEILGRGDIIVSNTIEVPNQNYHIFQFFASFSMFPKAQLVVHYIKDNEIVSDRLEIEFGNELQNEVNIEISASKASPDQAVDITVSSRPNSFIGLLGVDQNALQLKDGNDLYEAEALDELDQYNRIYYPPGWRGKRFSYPYVDIWMDFDSAGAILLTNANPVERKPPSSTITPYDNEIIHGVITTIKKTDIGPAHVLRTNTRPPLAGPYAFSRIPKPFRNHPHVHTKHIIEDTWLFVNFTTGADGKQSIRKALPNSMTSWVITGFAIDPINGLGLTKRPQTVQAFQQFMVSVDLPHSVKRGETLAIPIMIFNNLNRDLDTEITLHNEEQDFDFVDVNESAGDNPKIELYRRKRVSVASGKGSPASFIIRPKKVGLMTIKVKATSPYAGDEIVRVLPVEPEGIPQYFTKAVLIDLRDKSNYDGNLTIEIPKNAIPDSSRIEVAALGDILAGAVQNLDSLIRMPVGCGEQNMLAFTSNIIILDYLKATNQLTLEIRNKANLIELGYQRELAYIHKDGSFSAFGGDDKNGSTWLTALVARSFRMATNYIDVEEKIISDALSWLSKLQAPDGSFPEGGTISHLDLQNGGGQSIALTAYTLIAFLENRDQTPAYRNVINKAMDYIARNIAGSEDLYSLAVASYALQLAQHNSKDYILQTFDSRSKHKGELKWWEKPIPKSDEKNVWYQQKNSVNIELTAYGLLALLEAGHINDGLPVFKWLLSQRDSKGGFVSTQDTAVGLLALTKYAERIRGAANNVQIRVKYNEGTENRLSVNDGNALVLQNIELPRNVRQVNISASGRGLALLQLSYKYNTNVTAAWPRFTLDPQINKNSNSDYLHLTVCVNFVPAGGVNESNMAVMEVNFPSGFTADVFTLPSLESDVVKKVEARNDDTTVVIYFDRIGIRELCPTLDAFRTNKVAKQRQSSVTIFDYYDNSRRARQFYNAPKTTLCDICDGNDCGDTCAIRASKQRGSKSAFDGEDSAKQVNANGGAPTVTCSALTFILLCLSNYFIW